MTSEHLSHHAPDPTLTDPPPNASERGHAPAHPPTSSQLARLKISLHSALRQFPDFPTLGILFEDILPIFAKPELHEQLITALELHISETYGAGNRPDVIVGLEARGFLFGPTLALRLGSAFVPVRKKGKLPGPTVEATYEKEYGEDFFQMQADGIREGQKVLVVDDIIATGTSFNLIRSVLLPSVLTIR